MPNTKFIIKELANRGAWLDYRDDFQGGFGWWGNNNLSSYEYGVAHHDTNPPLKNAWKEVARIANAHINGRGWGGIGYHIIVTSEEVNGVAKVAYTGDLGSRRAHATNSKAVYNMPAHQGNTYLLGICVVGSFEGNKRPTLAQRKSFKLVVEGLIADKRFPGIKDWGDIKPHKDFNSTLCPGKWDELYYLYKDVRLDLEPDWKKGFVRKANNITSDNQFKLYDIRNNEVVKEYSESHVIETAYERGDWLMTEFSYKNNQPHAFKRYELTDNLVEFMVQSITGEDVLFERIGITSEEEAHTLYHLEVERLEVESTELGEDIEVRLYTKTNIEEEYTLVKSQVLEAPVKKLYTLIYSYQDGVDTREYTDAAEALEAYNMAYRGILDLDLEGATITLKDIDEDIINSYTHKMQTKPRENLTHKTIGEHIKSTTEIAVPVQTVTTFFGVIFSYYTPGMPTEVQLAFIGLFGIIFNVLYIFVINKLNDSGRT